MNYLKATANVTLFIFLAYIFISLFILIGTPAEAMADVDWWEGDQQNMDYALDNWWDTLYDWFTTPDGPGLDFWWWLRK